MALVLSVAGEDKSRRLSFRAEKKPWLLQDYLRDDANSCSSNGFRSFPRRECCAAVKSIIDKEFIQNAGISGSSKRLTRSRTISSALHKASMAVINAVKFLPFKSAAGSSSAKGDAKRLLPRSFSKKLFKRSFCWKKSGGERKAVKKADDDECDEIERWIKSGVVTSEKYQPLDLSNKTAVTNASSTTTRTSNSDGKSDSWSDITFTSDYLTYTSSENDIVDRREKFQVEDVGEEVGGRGGATTVEDSVEPAVAKNT
uniref:Uncharacterized protein n=2 Tax=Opuntia streptacantha TaxID=393608 RepID=A0A7C9FLJ7_OPUST